MLRLAPPAILIVWAVAVGAFRLVTSPLASTGNNALYLYTAGLLLDGQLPYRDWWELNPPLVTYLNVIPVLAARVLDLHPIPVFNTLVIALSLWSALTVVGLIRRLDARTTAFDSVAVGVALLLTVLTWPTSHGTSFGERDHVFTVLFLPYLAIRTARWQGLELTPRAAAYGAAAAVGALLKPQTIFVALAVELYWIVTTRRWRPLRAPETMAAVAVAAAYAVHFALFPAIGRPFFFDLVPLVTSGYDAFDAPMSELLASAGMALVRAAPMFILLAFAARFSPLRALVAPLLVMYVAGNVVFVAHGKGWPYTYHVARQAEVLLAAVMFSGVWHWLNGRGYLWPRIGYSGALAAGALAFAVTHARAPDHVSDVAPIVGAAAKRGEYVLVMATSGPAAYPTIVQLGVRQASRYLWPFPAVLMNADRIRAGDRAPAAPRSDAEARFLREIADDIRRLRPQVVLIQREPACAQCERFTLARYFRETRVVQDALAESYYPGGTADGFSVYYLR